MQRTYPIPLKNSSTLMPFSLVGRVFTLTLSLSLTSEAPVSLRSGSPSCRLASSLEPLVSVTNKLKLFLSDKEWFWLLLLPRPSSFESVRSLTTDAARRDRYRIWASLIEYPRALAALLRYANWSALAAVLKYAN